VELLQKSVVEHLTRYRYLEQRDFEPVVPIVIANLEALYAYIIGWSKIFEYENFILHKAAIVPLHESDFVAKFESN